MLMTFCGWNICSPWILSSLYLAIEATPLLAWNCTCSISEPSPSHPLAGFRGQIHKTFIKSYRCYSQVHVSKDFGQIYINGDDWIPFPHPWACLWKWISSEFPYGRRLSVFQEHHCGGVWNPPPLGNLSSQWVKIWTDLQSPCKSLYIASSTHSWSTHNSFQLLFSTAQQKTIYDIITNVSGITEEA